MISQLGLLDIQFSEPISAVKLNRLVQEVRRLQQTANIVIAELNASAVRRVAGAAGELAPGEWDIAVNTAAPGSFIVRYNEGGTIRTGSVTLS